LNDGWTPIGDATNNFTGTFDGQGFRIRNLYARGDANNNAMGLLGVSGSSVIRSIAIVEYSLYGEGGTDDVGGLVGDSSSAITAAYSSGTADGGASLDDVGGLAGENNSDIIAAYSTGNIAGGVGNDNVGGLVGSNRSGAAITASYSSGNAAGGAGNDNVGGLAGNNSVAITASYSTGNADGGTGNDNVGGLAGNNSVAITASYSTGNADGGAGAGIDTVGGLVGTNKDSGAINAAYGFGSVANLDIDGVPRAADADYSAVISANALTQANSSTMAANRWSTDVWDFGTSIQPPALKWITGFTAAAGTTAASYDCDQTLLPTGQTCGGLIPGQGR
jgi:hypothetical protein